MICSGDELGTEWWRPCGGVGAGCTGEEDIGVLRALPYSGTTGALLLCIGGGGGAGSSYPVEIGSA